MMIIINYNSLKFLNNIIYQAIGGGIGGGGSSSAVGGGSATLPTAEQIETKPKSSRRVAKGGGMQLKGKKSGLDSFVDQLESEGENSK